MQRSQLKSVAELSQLIEEGQLSYAAQAIRPVGRPSGSHRWFEWLVRPPISDPNLTVRDFILAVESLDLSLDLDTRIVRDALAWLDQQPINTRLCINVSTATLVNRHFSEFVMTALDNSHLLASQVCFDIALSDAEGHFAGVSRFIRVVQARGCEVAVDLAAQGNALLGMLAPLGLVNYLKIDHTCVQAAPTSPAHREVMESLCEYSARLGLPVIAKGVDSDVHRDLLAELGVDFYQGFVDGEPVLVTEPEVVEPVQVIEHSA